MKLCIDCKSYDPLGVGYCRNAANGVSPVDGSIRPRFANVERMPRILIDDETYTWCGPEGLLWEQKPPAPPSVPFWKVWARK